MTHPREFVIETWRELSENKLGPNLLAVLDRVLAAHDGKVPYEKLLDALQGAIPPGVAQRRAEADRIDWREAARNYVASMLRDLLNEGTLEFDSNDMIARAIRDSETETPAVGDNSAGDVERVLAALPLAPSPHGRRLVLTPASSIQPQSVKWLWQGRIPAGTLGLIAGREGIGKSLTLIWLAAQITTGELPGADVGRPRPVIYAASEDSWAHTIVPRLIAAGANLDMVFQVAVENIDGSVGSLTLPVDTALLAAEARGNNAAMIAIDPLMSVIASSIDTHKDRDLRSALEPLTRLADETGCAVVGLVHHGKGSSTDPLSLILGSRAFTAVPRWVMADPRPRGH